MAASKKLSLAVKALYVIERHLNEPLSSNQIASELGVNPSKLRRILSLLVKSNLVESTQGTSGGFVLKRVPDTISLQEIYCSVEENKAFYLDVHDHEDCNSSSSKMNNFFYDLFADVQVAIENKMSQISLKDVVEKIDN
ncbi:MAG: transcriptional regulator [Calditrichaeota bacterium]|nr:MAG: transcriptional regulator [Calditrichota bacterium]MBL1206989.1 transcriptional regulator [Calditrichota bacterium]NOG46816.1 Rrf2 family transcriptional regulator [Calditrichota bacterium]